MGKEHKQVNTKIYRRQITKAKKFYSTRDLRDEYNMIILTIISAKVEILAIFNIRKCKEETATSRYSWGIIFLYKT